MAKTLQEILCPALIPVIVAYIAKSSQPKYFCRYEKWPQLVSRLETIQPDIIIEPVVQLNRSR